jgi:hypothetical protein
MKKPLKTVKTKSASLPAAVTTSDPEPDTATLVPASHAQEGDIATYLVPNARKTDVRQPTLLGMVKFGSLVCEQAIWWSETMDGQRDYYTLAISDAVAKREALKRKETLEPLHKFRLFQFAQREITDPAYVSERSFLQDGTIWWALLWVDCPLDCDNVEEIKYVLVFSPRRPQERWTDRLKDSLEGSLAHFKARQSELEGRLLYNKRRAEQQRAFDADQIPL